MKHKFSVILGIAIVAYFYITILISCVHNTHLPKRSKESQWYTPTPSTLMLTPNPTLAHVPTPEPTPAPTPHPDLKEHHVTREWIEGYENMSEAHIQELLNMFDEGYEFKEEEIWEDNPAGLTYDDGYEDGYADGYDEGYEDGQNNYFDDNDPDYDASYDYADRVYW